MRPAWCACSMSPLSHDVGHDPQPDRGRGPGRRRRGHGHRHGAARRAPRSAPKATRSTRTCWTTSCRRCPTRRRSSSGSSTIVDRTAPDGGKGIGEPPCVPTPGAIANAIAQVTGVQVKRLPMTPTRVWEATWGWTSDRHLRRRHLDRRGAGRARRRAHARSPGGTDLVVGAPQRQGARCPSGWSPSTARRAAQRSPRRRRPACSARWSTTSSITQHPSDPRRLHRAGRLRRPSSAPTRPATPARSAATS